MTNLKCFPSALGFVLAFFASTAAFGYTSFEEVDVLSTEPIFQLVEQRVPTEQCQVEYVSANSQDLTINHRRRGSSERLWEEQSEMR